MIGVKRDKSAHAFVSVRAKREIESGALEVVRWLWREQVLALPISNKPRYGDFVSNATHRHAQD